MPWIKYSKPLLNEQDGVAHPYHFSCSLIFTSIKLWNHTGKDLCSCIALFHKRSLLTGHCWPFHHLEHVLHWCCSCLLMFCHDLDICFFIFRQQCSAVRGQWRSQPKNWGSKYLILGEQHYFLYKDASQSTKSLCFLQICGWGVAPLAPLLATPMFGPLNQRSLQHLKKKSDKITIICVLLIFVAVIIIKYY